MDSLRVVLLGSIGVLWAAWVAVLATLRWRASKAEAGVRGGAPRTYFLSSGFHAFETPDGRRYNGLLWRVLWIGMIALFVVAIGIAVIGRSFEAP